MADRSGQDQPRWRRIEEDGVEWEARVVPGPRQIDPDREGHEEEVLEFVCVSGGRKTRRLAVRPGSLDEMDGEQLHRAYLQARPIGGDHYGRPGKTATDAG